MDERSVVSTGNKWTIAWRVPQFRFRFISGWVILVMIFISFPFFFQTIEKRQGLVLNDWLLSRLPAYNVSVPIFIVIWALTAMMLIRIIQNPDIFLTFLWAYVIVSLSRLLSISIVALDPPRGLMELKDPISNTFYGMKVVTRDLFYSGHTSSVFLMFLCLKNKRDKFAALLVSMIVAILLLIQHVHYTIDVLAAFLFTWLIYLLVRRIISIDFKEYKR